MRFYVFPVNEASLPLLTRQVGVSVPIRARSTGRLVVSGAPPARSMDRPGALTRLLLRARGTTESRRGLPLGARASSHSPGCLVLGAWDGRVLGPASRSEHGAASSLRPGPCTELFTTPEHLSAFCCELRIGHTLRPVVCSPLLPAARSFLGNFFEASFAANEAPDQCAAANRAGRHGPCFRRSGGLNQNSSKLGETLI